MISAARGEFAHAIYELSLAATDPKNFDRLSRALHNIDMATVKKDQISIQEKSHALALERLAFEKLKFEFDASRELLKCAVQYTAVIKDESADDQDKIWKARQICFGSLPENVLSGAFYARAQTQSQSSSSAPSQKSDTLIHDTADGGTSSASPAVPQTAAPAPSISASSRDCGDQTSVPCPAPAAICTEAPASSLSPQSSVLATEAKAPDTLGHTGTHYAENTQRSASLETQSSVPRPATAAISTQHSPPSDQRPALTARSMPYADWIAAASDKKAMRDFIFETVAGTQWNFDFISKSNTPIWIQDPAILRLTVPTAQ